MAHTIRLKNGLGSTKTDRQRSQQVKGFGGPALAAEFDGTFIEEGRSDGTMASSEYTPEVTEEDERVFGHDSLRRFVPVDDLPALGQLSGQRWAQFIR